MMVKMVVVLGVLAVGCGTVEVAIDLGTAEARAWPQKPGQAEALAIILQAWAQPEVPMQLEWVEGDALDCGPASFVNVDGACVYGTVEWESPPRVRVGWEPTDTFSTTTLAHELCHLYFGDHGHDAECGTRRPASRVTSAEQALRAANL
jgi:hypothetical protein